MAEELERLVNACRTAAKEADGPKAVLEVIQATVTDDTAAQRRMLGEPERAGVTKLYCAPDLTILNLVWGPHMTAMPHDHRMWAVIGIVAGAEDNIFWRRDGEALRACGARALRAGDAELLGPDVIHSVTNPVRQLTSAIHVYGGDFFAASRSEWDPQTLRELPYDVEKTLRMFEESNARLEAA